MNIKDKGKVKVSGRNLKKISEIICMSNTIDKPFQVIGITDMNTEVAINSVWKTTSELTVSVKKEFCELLTGMKIKSIAYFQIIAIDFFKEIRYDKNIAKNTNYYKTN